MRTFLKVCVVTTTLVFAAGAGAQEAEIKTSDLVRYYDAELFQWNFGMFSGLTLSYQNQNSVTSLGINASMKKALAQYRDTKKLYASYRAKTTIGQILTVGGLAAVITGVYMPFFTYQDTDVCANFPLALGLIVGGIISEGIGSYVLLAGQESIFNAVSVYNRHKMSEYK